MKKNTTLFFITLTLCCCICLNSQASNQSKDFLGKANPIIFSLNEYTAPGKTLVLHDEVIGTFAFEQYSSELLLLTATLEKKHFVHALKKEGVCTLEEMIRVCGNNYLTENFEVVVNDQKVTLEQESTSIDKDFIILTYNIPISKEAIKHIKVTSDYMFKYNHHSMLKVIFELTGRPRIFNIRNKKRTINARFKNLK